MTGKNTRKKSEELDEAQIVDWLAQRPDFFQRHPDCLSALDLPVDSGPAISLHQYQVRVLREEKLQLNQKLAVLVKNVKTNHKIQSDLLALAGNMIGLANTGADQAAFLEMIKQHFGLFDVQLVKKADDSETWERLETRLGKRESSCDNAIDLDLREILFADQAAAVASIAVVAVRQGKKTAACLVLASDDEERFKPGMGGEFLKWLALLVSNLLEDEPTRA